MPRLGEVLASKYRLEQLLGSGGMGHVYRATNEDIGRAVAIKVLRSEHATNPKYVDRFLREARAANLVRHPNVVDILDVGRDSDGSPFLVQELLHGRDLLSYVQDNGGMLTVPEIGELVLPVIEAVGLAHAQGVVHRDIKPENVFLAEVNGKRVPKLLDFGISKMRAPNIRVTEVGTMMGTPAYMAPEQIQGTEADPRSDVWALGVMLFELLAGRYPFQERDAPALFVLVVTKDMPALVDVLPSVSPEVSELVGRCLRRNANERYATAAELAEDLRNVLAGKPLEATHRHSVTATPSDPHGLDIPDLVLPEAAPPPPQPARAAAAPTRAGFDDLQLDRGEAPTSIATYTAAPDPPEPPALDVPAPEPKRPSAQRIPLNPAGSTYGYDDPRSAAPPARRAPPAVGWAPTQVAAEPEDMSVLVALAVVIAVCAITTALLTALGHRTEGLSLLGFFMKPSESLDAAANLAAGAVAFLCCIGLARAGFRSWRLTSGKGAAIVRAAFGGAFLFVAIELARTAL